MKLTFLLLMTLSSWAQDTDRTRLHYLKTVEWPKAYREQDTLLLKQILADEFQSIDAAGNVSTKNQEVAYIAANKPTYSSFTFTISRLDIFENNTAVVSGTGLIKGRNQEGNWEMTYRSSNVFLKRKGQWQAISSHISGTKRKQQPASG